MIPFKSAWYCWLKTCNGEINNWLLCALFLHPKFRRCYYTNFLMPFSFSSTHYWSFLIALAGFFFDFENGIWSLSCSLLSHGLCWEFGTAGVIAYVPTGIIRSERIWVIGMHLTPIFIFCFWNLPVLISLKGWLITLLPSFSFWVWWSAFGWTFGILRLKGKDTWCRVTLQLTCFV